MSSPTALPIELDPNSSHSSSSKPSLWTQIKTLSPIQSAKRLGEGKVQCSRSSLLLGIGTAVAVSGVGAIAGRGTKSALNWGAASFVLVSCVSWQNCRMSRAAESQRMRTVIEDFNRKRSRGAGVGGGGVGVSDTKLGVSSQQQFRQVQQQERLRLERYLQQQQQQQQSQQQQLAIAPSIDQKAQASSRSKTKAIPLQPTPPAPPLKKPSASSSHNRSVSNVQGNNSQNRNAGMQPRRRSQSQSLASQYVRYDALKVAAVVVAAPSAVSAPLLPPSKLRRLPPGPEESIRPTTAAIGPPLPPRKRCQSCSPADHTTESATSNIADIATSSHSVITTPVDRLNPPLSFDDEDDSIWVHLVQAGSPIKIKFDSSTPFGDARKMARLFAASLEHPPPTSNFDNDVPALKAKTPAPIHFLPNGKVGQTLQSNRDANEIFVEYPQHMTLSQARQVGDKLAGAIRLYKG